jgi:hypothetical protein
MPDSGPDSEPSEAKATRGEPLLELPEILTLGFKMPTLRLGQQEPDMNHDEFFRRPGIWPKMTPKQINSAHSSITRSSGANAINAVPTTTIGFSFSNFKLSARIHMTRTTRTTIPVHKLIFENDTARSVMANWTTWPKRLAIVPQRRKSAAFSKLFFEVLSDIYALVFVMIIDSLALQIMPGIQPTFSAPPEE